MCPVVKLSLLYRRGREANSPQLVAPMVPYKTGLMAALGMAALSAGLSKGEQSGGAVALAARYARSARSARRSNVWALFPRDSRGYLFLFAPSFFFLWLRIGEQDHKNSAKALYTV
jgi:hypothetical protein